MSQANFWSCWVYSFICCLYVYMYTYMMYVCLYMYMLYIYNVCMFSSQQLVKLLSPSPSSMIRFHKTLSSPPFLSPSLFLLKFVRAHMSVYVCSPICMHVEVGHGLHRSYSVVLRQGLSLNLELTGSQDWLTPSVSTPLPSACWTLLTKGEV